MHKYLVVALLMATILPACNYIDATNSDSISNANHDADTVYQSGRVYTVDSDNPWVEAFAVADGKFVAVGSNKEVASLIGPATEVVDLAGTMVMPGIHDAHAHPGDAGIRALFECSFPYSLSMDEVLNKVVNCSDGIKPGSWLRGGQWPVELLDSENAPDRYVLDKLVPDIPVLLMDSTVHVAWVNSKALELLGIDKDTPNPDGGVIVRDKATGEATGILHDDAAYEAVAKLPGYSVAQLEQALSKGLSKMNAVGVTGVNDAYTDVVALKAYSSLDKKKQLSAQIATSLSRTAWFNFTDVDQETIVENRKQFESDNVEVDFVKIMLDGIPPTKTSAMLDAYVSDDQHTAGHKGKLSMSAEQFRKALIHLDAAGITAKVHATGDRAVRVVLDAVEEARKQNGDSGLYHEVSHAGIIHPDDMSRFGTLNVTAEVSPIVWYPSHLQAMMASTLGEERSNRLYPIKSYIDNKTFVIYGSDWPAAAPSPNPWPGLEAMVNRRNPYNEYAGVANKEQAISLSNGIRIMTINGAKSMARSDSTGSIEAGKNADFIQLNQNLFEIDSSEISETKVLRTVFQGKTVYRAGEY